MPGPTAQAWTLVSAARASEEAGARSEELERLPELDGKKAVGGQRCRRAGSNQE